MITTLFTIARHKISYYLACKWLPPEWTNKLGKLINSVVAMFHGLLTVYKKSNIMSPVHFVKPRCRSWINVT